MTRKMTKHSFPYALMSSTLGNRPCQHDRGLARYRRLCAGGRPRRGKRSSLAFA
jgi:hypothetical protein